MTTPNTHKYTPTLYMKLYTPGRIAKLCHVSPHTVGKWIDNGQLEGFKLPGSTHRKVPRDKLINFLKSNNMPIPSELST